MDEEWKFFSAYDNRKKAFMERELFNLKEDRSEWNDLGEKFPEKKAEKIQAYEKWAERVGVVPREVLDRKK